MTETNLPPDIAELREAQLVIDEVYKALNRADALVETLEGVGPRDVLAPAATHYKDVADLEDAIERLRIRVYHVKNHYQMRILPDLFFNASTDRVVTLNGFTITKTDDLSVSIPKEKRDEAYDWLSKNGYGDIITSTVNSSTLKATVKSIDNENRPLPPDDVFTITRLPKYSVRAVAKKIPSTAHGDV